MMKLIYTEDRSEASPEDKQRWILEKLVTEFADDTDFLKRVNKVTFGLFSIRDYNAER